jgi:uncharacterized protein with LGFP repeats
MNSTGPLAPGAEHGFLGYPTTHEQPANDGVGRFNDFQNGSIYWHPDTGAFAVSGPVLARWKEVGAETGYLGYPVADEVDAGGLEGRRVIQFQNGAIFSRPDGGVLEVPHTVVFNSWPIVTDETLGGSTL